MKLHELTIHEAHDLLKTRQISSTELTRDVLDHIDKTDDKIGAYLSVFQEQAIAQARDADNMIARNEIQPLTGIPLSIKDLICTKDLPTTCASKILENFIPPYDATVMVKLKNAGAVTLGKANMDEFAMGSSTENSSMHLTRNPWDVTRIPGGSSGGSAASVAADMCIGSLGSDTGGSIRQPASHCGIVGMKPTYGRVSRFGLVAFASSLDQIGPLTKDVTDCALLMNVISGYDPADSTSVPKEVPDFQKSLSMGINGIKIGLPKEYYTTDGMDPDVAAAIDNAIHTMKNLGAEFVDVSLPHTQYAVAVYYVIAPCEASSNLARYDGVRYGFRDREPEDLIQMYRSTKSKGFGPEVQRRIIIGTYALSAGYYDAYYGKASQVRTLMIEDFQNAFQKCDLLLSPVTPSPAFKIGEKVNDPLYMYLSDIFTLSANLTGVPGISIPCGFSKDRLPIGLQLMGRHFNEELLIKVAYNFEQATTFHKEKPAL
ncbi:MAG: Asp-tRNA(Asn)/Glu-tRNA(Gln) amidotransferase subunit GatA [Pseudomonadota bacterium]